MKIDRHANGIIVLMGYTALYTQYFTQQGHPAGPSILLEAAAAAGVSRERAEAFVADEYEALAETRMLLQEQVSNGVDSVRPHPFP